MMGLEERILVQKDILLVATVAFIVITTVSVTLRVIVRARILHTFGPDDWTLLLAQALFYITTGLTFCTVQTVTALADGESHVSRKRAIWIIRLVNCAYVMTVVVAKISLSMFFLQLFGITHRWQKIYTYVAMALSTAFGLVFVGLILFSCGIQDPTILQADTCDIHVPYKALSLTWSFLNVLTDISFAILAVMLLWHTKLARWTKASSCALLIFGTLGGIASVLRITVQLIPLPQPLKVIITGRWSNIEGGTYITTASLATIRPLCRKACGFFRARPKRHSDDDHFVEYIHRTLSGGESTIEGGLVGGSKPVRPDIFRENSRDIFVTMEFGIDIEKRRSDSVVVPVPSNAMLNDTLYTV